MALDRTHDQRHSDRSLSHRLAVDPTVNLSVIIVLLGALLSGVVWAVRLEAKVKENADSVERIEPMLNEIRQDVKYLVRSSDDDFPPPRR